jgi:GNAT superfamily N-acetyltransferase
MHYVNQEGCIVKANTTNRRYRLLVDFSTVRRFLTDVYSIDTLNSYLLPQFFEYAHTHPAFQHRLAHRFGLWEDGGRLVGVACFEMNIGESFLVTDCEHTSLLPEMLEFAERELSAEDNGRRTLAVWVTDKESEKIKLLSANGYKRVYAEPVRIFFYDKPFPDARLPSGYSIISLEDENDYKKINDCLWKGFDHGDEPDDDLDGRMLMQSGPNFRKDLTTVIKAPNGKYACFAGMWFDEVNKYAYLEPLATVPEHRRKGLATVALAEGIRKTKALGATYCFGGVPEFYTALGFETVCSRELWKKELR